MRARHLLIRTLTPLIWRVSEKRKLAALQEFSDTELDSGWQSLYSLDKVADPKAKAELFQHALEEFYHSDLFAGLLRSYSNSPLNRQIFAREPILDDRDGKAALLNFLVQVYVGETEINHDFVVYSEMNVDQPIRDLFKRIKKDEEGHEDSSWNLMLTYAEGRVWHLRRIVFQKRVAHAWQRFANLTQVMGDIWLSAVLSALYFVAGSFFFLTLRRRLSLDRSAQLEILRQQLGVNSNEAKP